MSRGYTGACPDNNVTGRRLRNSTFLLIPHKISIMHYHQFIITFAGTAHPRNQLGNRFYISLKKYKEEIGFTYIRKAVSDLTSVSIAYLFEMHDLSDLVRKSCSTHIFQLRYQHNPLHVNPIIDEIFLSSVSECEEPIHATCFYLVQDGGEIIFHQVSRNLYKSKVSDDDHLNMDGLISGQPHLFFRHFYLAPYTESDIAHISKMALVTGKVVRL